MNLIFNKVRQKAFTKTFFKLRDAHSAVFIKLNVSLMMLTLSHVRIPTQCIFNLAILAKVIISNQIFC